jgi:hypothetical protein
MTSRGREWILAAVLAAAAAALLSTTFLLGSSADEEEFRFAVLSAWLRVQALTHGDLGLWTSLLGLGVPQPFVPNFALHPLAPLLAWVPPATWVRVLLVFHTVVGATGMWRVCSLLGLAPIVRATGVVTFLLASPAQNYVLSDFWPSHYIVWTLAPWVLLIAWRVLASETANVRRWSCALGVISGIAAANANPAYLLVFVPLAATVLVLRVRQLRARWRWVALSAVLALTIAAPTFAQLVSERQHFAPEQALSNVTDPLSLRAALMSAFAPFTDEPMDSRSIFFGAPYAVLAVVGCLRFARARTDLTVSAAIYAVLVFTTWIPMPWISQRYQFRDPLMLCGILLAGLAVNTWHNRPHGRTAIVAVLALQAASVIHVALPALQRTIDSEGRRAVAFRGATGNTPLVDGLVALTREPGRLAYSPQVDYEVSERALVIDGIGVNALAYRNVPVVNGSFKSASADLISPDERLFYGRIRLPPPFIASPAGLDVLGVRYLLARRGEVMPPGLRELGAFPTARGGELVLYDNPDAWPGAFLVPAAFGDEPLPVLPACGHDRLLCRDLAPIAAHRDTMPLTTARGNGEIHVRSNAAAEPRILVVIEMFRPEWLAYADGRRVATREMYGGLIGVPLPSGVGNVRLRYSPGAISFITWVSLIGSIVGSVAAAVPRSRFRVPGSGSRSRFEC